MADHDQEIRDNPGDYSLVSTLAWAPLNSDTTNDPALYGFPFPNYTDTVADNAYDSFVTELEGPVFNRHVQAHRVINFLPHAPENNRWADEREQAGGNEDSVDEARDIADDVEEHATAWNWTAWEEPAVATAGSRWETDGIVPNTHHVPSVNLHYFDIAPSDISAWYLRRRKGLLAGAPLLDKSGDPFVLWKYFIKILADLVFEALDVWAFPPHSFWQLQIVDHARTFGESVLSTYHSYDTPTRALVMDALDGLNDGLTSDTKFFWDQTELSYFTSDSTVRFMVGNPSTGQGGPLPTHLRNKHSVWSPGGEHCAPKAIIVCLATGDDRQHLKRKNGINPRINKKVEELERHVGCSAAWGFSDIAKAGAHLGTRVCVLDAYTYVTLFDTHEGGSAATDREVFLLYDAVGEHFMACFSPGALKHGR